MSNKSLPDPGKRLASLDAVRGFDMLFIMGFSTLVIAVCKLFPNGTESWICQQMNHVAWDGIRHHDTIFPLFIFIAGISFPFSYAKQQEKGVPRGKIYWKAIRRALILVLCLAADRITLLLAKGNSERNEAVPFHHFRIAPGGRCPIFNVPRIIVRDFHIKENSLENESLYS